MLKSVTPLLRVTRADVAEQFYCDLLSFQQTFAYRPDDERPDPCYMGLQRDGVSLHVSSFPGDGVIGGVVNVYVDSVDELHAELVGRGVAIDSGPVDQTWGNREMYVKDRDGNSLRFIQPAGLASSQS